MKRILTLAAIVLSVSCASQNKAQNSLPMNQTTLTPNNGVVMPQFGLGVYSIPEGEITYNSVLTAIAPSVGIAVYHWTGNFDILFWMAFVVAGIGLWVDSTIKVRERQLLKGRKARAHPFINPHLDTEDSS